MSAGAKVAMKGVPLDGIKDPVVRAALLRMNGIYQDLSGQVQTLKGQVEELKRKKVQNGNP